MSIMTLSGAINNALRLEMEADQKVYLLGIDIGFFGGVMGVTAGLQEQFGQKRVRDTPISESAIIGAAVGSAAMGLRPVAELMFMDFIGVMLDQLMNQAAKMRYMFGGKASIPMVMRTCYGAGIGAAAQHSQSLEALLMHIPGIKVVMPSTPYDAKGLLISAIRDNNPVVFMEHKALYFTDGEVPDESYTVPLGEADIKREGTDVTIVATGQTVPISLSAAEKLSGDGVSVEVVDPRTISPLDETTILESVKKTNRLIIVHEAVQFGGPGGEIAAMVSEKAFDFLDAPIIRIAAPFCPVPFSSKLEREYIPNENRIIEAVKSIVEV
jgi:acetoin:2,6-dichlorophenolindophenol oxidoreductase subunit beta